jgi:hypothetical protein
MCPRYATAQIQARPAVVSPVCWLGRLGPSICSGQEIAGVERVPLDWAMTPNNLGNSLRALGERESGTARLEEAVAAYRSMLHLANHRIEGTVGTRTTASARVARRLSAQAAPL